MGSSLKSIARDWLVPPAIWNAAKAVKVKLKPPPTKGSEQDASWYDRVFEDAAVYNMPYYDTHYYFMWCAIVDRIIRDNPRLVLDIGCGPGQVAAFLRDRGLANYIGLDLSTTAIKRAQSLCPEYTFLAQSIYDSDVLEQVDYDFVMSLEFLEHVERDLEVLERIKSGVRFIGSVPDFPYPSHVRHFANCEEVAERYGSLFANFTVTEFIAPARRHRYFLLDGIKR